MPWWGQFPSLVHMWVRTYQADYAIKMLIPELCAWYQSNGVFSSRLYNLVYGERHICQNQNSSAWMQVGKRKQRGKIICFVWLC